MYKAKQNKAFTLVELLVSVAILLLVLGAAVSVEVQNIGLADRNEHYLQATNLAQQQLNLVKTVRDNNPANPFGSFPTDTEAWRLGLPLGSSQWQFFKESTYKPVGGRDYTIEIRVFDITD